MHRVLTPVLRSISGLKRSSLYASLMLSISLETAHRPAIPVLRGIRSSWPSEVARVTSSFRAFDTTHIDAISDSRMSLVRPTCDEEWGERRGVRIGGSVGRQGEI